MNTTVEGIIVNNCQYTPIYLIQDPGATQSNTYVLTPTNVDESKPVSNNLKTFYESSGNIENGLVNADTAIRPSVKKKEVFIGNNLKLASFLMPKTENVHKQYIVDNIVLKSNINTPVNNPVPINTVPKIDIDRKIVRLKEVPIINKRPEKVLPKIKPKENAPSPNQSKHTSVQLIKLGETYHSLNHLSKEQIKMVNQALKMFKDPDKMTPQPTYDPVTNTQYIYKVVSPKDLTVVGQKKVVLKEKKLTKVSKKVVEEKIMKQLLPIKEVIEELAEPEPPVESKFTRSGRKVKLPKQILPEDSPQKTKKKTGTIISCFQCSAEFSSLYRLQKHYENHPTHIPAKIHSNLFHCLLAIIKGGSEGDKTNIFMQQLEQLIVKLKSLLPCLLKKMDGADGQPCTINDDIGRLLGMTPGKYNINVEALNCVKDQNGHCVHNPPKVNHYTKDQISSTLMKNNEDLNNCENDNNCARINSVAKWPTVSKRIWKLKQKTHELSAKKMRLKSESDTFIDLGTEDLMLNSEDNRTDAHITIPPEDDVVKLVGNGQECNINPPVHNTQINIPIPEQSKLKSNHVQFHSTHFDIRSSPIKPSSTVFRKFQINPSKMSNYQVQVIRSLEMIDKDNRTVKSPNINNCDNNIHLADTDSNLHSPLSNSDNAVHITLPNSENGLNVAMPSSDNGNGLHVTLPNSDNGLHLPLPNSDNGISVSMPNSNTNLHVSLPSPDNSLQGTLQSTDTHSHTTLSSLENNLHVSLPNAENSLDISLPNTDNSLHDIFKDDVDLSCKDDSIIDPVLKEWIISTSDKSEDTFTKSNSLIEPAFLHVGDNDKCINKTGHQNDMPSLDDTSNRLLSTQSHGESVLNFLETLGNDLVYPETEIRNNSIDFHLDLFTFHNS